MTSKELAEKLANEIQDMTGATMYTDNWIDSDDDVRTYCVFVDGIDRDYAIDAMFGSPKYASFGDSSYRIVRAFNDTLKEHDEDCIIAEYIHDLITDYHDILPLDERDELCYVEMEVDDMLVEWYEHAVQNAAYKANDIIHESLPKYLSDYSESELYAELRRRGHYDVYEVTESDLDSDIREWAKENGKLDELMDDWHHELIDQMEPGDVLYDTLFEVAEKLGYEA